MTPGILLLVSAAGVFGIIYPIVRYIPLSAKAFGKIWSPRLQACKLLTLFDATFTFILILGAWVGISTSVTGISMMIYNVMTGVGISLGIIVVQKFFIPRWQKQFEILKEKHEREHEDGKKRRRTKTPKAKRKTCTSSTASKATNVRVFDGPV